jgi:hypothetical protein
MPLVLKETQFKKSRKHSGRVVKVSLTEAESECMRSECERYLSHLDPNASITSDAGMELADVFGASIQEYVPALSENLAKERNGEIDALFAEGLPKEERPAKLAILSLTKQLGRPFNFSTQLKGELVMSIRPDLNSTAENTNTTTNEFRYHTDDAAIPRDYRTENINLYGIKNPPDTYTGFAPISPVIDSLAADTVNILFEERFNVRVPLSFNLGDNLWSSARPILSHSPEGLLEIAWPSYATRTVDSGDAEAARALNELEAALDRFVVRVAVNPGCFFSFNNSRGVHMRSKIGAGDRLLFRTYSRTSLDALQSVTGQSGPIFDTRILLSSCKI